MKNTGTVFSKIQPISLSLSLSFSLSLSVSLFLSLSLPLPLSLSLSLSLSLYLFFYPSLTVPLTLLIAFFLFPTFFSSLPTLCLYHSLPSHSFSPTNSCRAELGRFPLIINFQKRALKFWLNLKFNYQNTLWYESLKTQEICPKPSPLGQLVDC